MLYKLMMFFDSVAKQPVELPMLHQIIKQLQSENRDTLLLLRDGCFRLIELINEELQ